VEDVEDTSNETAARIHDFNACLKDGTGGIQIDVSWGPSDELNAGFPW
jgi:hypothetical protein